MRWTHITCLVGIADKLETSDHVILRTLDQAYRVGGYQTSHVECLIQIILHSMLLSRGAYDEDIWRGVCLERFRVQIVEESRLILAIRTIDQSKGHPLKSYKGLNLPMLWCQVACLFAVLAIRCIDSRKTES